MTVLMEAHANKWFLSPFQYFLSAVRCKSVARSRRADADIALMGIAEVARQAGRARKELARQRTAFAKEGGGLKRVDRGH